MPRFLPRLLALVFAVATAAVALRAQSIRWDPPGGTLGVGQNSPLNLVFEDCEPSADFKLPDLPNFNWGTPTQSSQTSIVNFKMSRRIVFTYPVLPIQRGPLVIPEFMIETDQGKIAVPAARFEVSDATVGSSNISIDRVAGSQVLAEAGDVWVGEVFPLQYRLLIVRRFNPISVDRFECVFPSTFTAEPWGRDQDISTNSGNEVRVGKLRRTRVIANQPGTLTLPPAKELVALETGTQSFGFFARPNVEQYLINSTPTTINVKPLPPGAPADFAKAVGQFTFESNIVPAATTVGEPITWTLKLEGTGNWPAGLSLPSREAPKSFQVLRPQTQRTMKEGSLFDGGISEDVVLVPTVPGTFRLGGVGYSYFDPKTGTYKTVRTPVVEVVVKPAAAPTTPNVVPGAPVIQFTPEAPATKSGAPTLPGRLPLEPLVGPAAGWRPFASLAPWTLTLPLGPVLALWLALGVRRARLTDPRRAQRDALRALQALAARLGGAQTRETLLALVTEWQALAATLWTPGRATPSADELAAAIRRAGAAPSADAWERLWREADAFRFGPPAPLPEDWRVRAAAAVNATRLPAPSWFAPLRWSNLLPMLALGFVLAAGFAAPRMIAAEAPARAAAEDPAASYRRGEFAAAEKIWRADLGARPTDWKARHNLGLALAQQDRWSEAAAHWSAAFLVAPREASVRWNLDVGLTKAEFTQPELVAFAGGHGAAWFARVASPGEWHVAIVGGAAVIGLALGALLIAVHFGRRRWLSWAAALAAVAGVLAIVGGFAALRVYGPLAEREALLVWKTTELRTIPTEAGAQKTEPLTAGTLAVGTKSFLGWQQIRLANGQTGWVRKENAVFFYR